NSSTLAGFTFEKAKIDRIKSWQLLLLSLFVVIGIGALITIYKFGFIPEEFALIKDEKPGAQNNAVHNIIQTPLEQEELEKNRTARPEENRETSLETPAPTSNPLELIDKIEDKPSPLPVTENSAETNEQFESVEPNRKPKEEDPLNKGDTLPAEQIRYKIVFKAIKDVAIRYQVDDRPLMNYRLLQNKIIVMRAQKWIIYQISDLHAVKYRLDKEKGYQHLDTERQKSIRSSSGPAEK
ncbi:hypothetical protein ACFL27_08565, partial [candidate division CSSED10-310 bacterium]